MDIDNYYHEELIGRKMDPTAENLIKILSPDVEDILAEWGRPDSSVSQYRRAQKVILDIRIGIGTTNKFGDRSRRIEQEDILLLFIAVWKTVRVLEGRTK